MDISLQDKNIRILWEEMSLEEISSERIYKEAISWDRIYQWGILWEDISLVDVLENTLGSIFKPKRKRLSRKSKYWNEINCLIIKQCVLSSSE